MSAGAVCAFFFKKMRSKFAYVKYFAYLCTRFCAKLSISHTYGYYIIDYTD